MKLSEAIARIKCIVPSRAIAFILSVLLLFVSLLTGDRFSFAFGIGLAAYSSQRTQPKYRLIEHRGQWAIARSDGTMLKTPMGALLLFSSRDEALEILKGIK